MEKWEYSPTRDDNKIGPLTDFDSYWFSLALNFEEYTSTHSTQAIKKSSRKNRIISLILSIFYANYFKYMEKWEYSPTRDDNKIGPLTDFDSYWFSLALNFDECTSRVYKYMEKWEYSPTRDDNKIGPLTDFDSYWFSLALNFEEYTSTHSTQEWEYTPTRDDNKIGPLTDFDSYWFSLALNFEEYTSTHSTQAIKKSSRKNRIISLILSIFYANYFKYMEKWEYSPTRDDNKIGPLTDFDSYWFSLALNFDECTSRVYKYMEKWEYSPTRDDNKIGPLTDFDSYWFSLALNFEEYTSTHSTQEWEYTPTRDDNKIGPLTDFDSYWFSLALNFEEYTSTHSTQAIKKSSRKNRIISLILSIFYANYFKYMEKWEYSPTRDDNKIGPLTDFDSYWFSLALNFEEYTSTHSTQAIKKSSRKNRIISLILSIFYANYFKYMEKWEYSPTRNDNKIGPLTDFDSYWFSLALNFDQCTSSTWRSGNTLPPVTTTKSDL
ncbi:LOW QUALITY PROTEIN: hypothetical protein V1477_013631 [Vespula maculifrons]|uniref:Uncharacterized protein n=1 Tax=Vespula maculifrons TaxID=7453 RepID=A0ABD2BRJ9_VESMC